MDDNFDKKPEDTELYKDNIRNLENRQFFDNTLNPEDNEDMKLGPEKTESHDNNPQASGSWARQDNVYHMRDYAKEDNNDNINKFTMDSKGNIHSARNGTAVVASSTRAFIVLGWVAALFTAFVSGYFAVVGVSFGFLANRQVRGSGNAVIITNIVLGAINLLFGFFGIFLTLNLRRMIGY